MSSIFTDRQTRAVKRAACVEPLESRQLLSANLFVQTNLVSDGAVPAAHVDTNLKNPWGVSYAPGGPFWVSDNATSMSTVYDGTGNAQGVAPLIPGAGGMPSAPTGQVYNFTGGFNVHEGSQSGQALFIFAGEDGGISGWSPSVDFGKAILAFDGTTQPGGAVYKGLAIAHSNNQPYLYAANFRSGNIDVLNSNFKLVHWKNAFQDKMIPAGFAPFNIQRLNGRLFVTYAKQDPLKHDDVAGPGNGYLDEYSTSGQLIRRYQHGAFLNSPWGLSFAPLSFGAVGHDLLVGNFGSGEIDAFNPKTGNFVATLDGTNAKPLVINGLWALIQGNNGAAGSSETVFFTAGINHEQDGLFGDLTLLSTTT